MKDKEKKRLIVPYGLNFGGPIIGDSTNNFAGLPLFVNEEPEEESDEL